MDATKTGSFIAQMRRERGMSQRELAERLLVSDKAVSRWETGRGMPDIDNLEALSRELDVGMAELLRGERIEEPLPASEADALATDGLGLVRQLMRSRLVGNVLLGFLVGAIVVALVAVHLTAPLALPFEDGVAHVERLADGSLVLIAGGNASGIDVDVVTDPNDGAVEAFVSCHTTALGRMAGQSSSQVALLGTAYDIDRVWYYPSAEGDLLLWPANGGVQGGVVTLPRLVYNNWAVIGAITSVIGLVAWFGTRRRWFGRHVLRAALVPACLTVSLVTVLWGRFDQVYDAPFYLSGIALVAMALYATCLLMLSRLPVGGFGASD